MFQQSSWISYRAQYITSTEDAKLDASASAGYQQLEDVADSDNSDDETDTEDLFPMRKYEGTYDLFYKEIEQQIGELAMEDDIDDVHGPSFISPEDPPGSDLKAIPTTPCSHV